MSLFDELKRRNVFKVGIAYLIIAWLMLQVVDIVGPILELPAVFGRAVLLLLAIGLPIAVILSWAYELTPEGVRKEKDVDRSASTTHHSGRKPELQHVGDARSEMPEPVDAVVPRARRASVLPLVAALVLGASIAGSVMWYFAAAPVVLPTTRFAVTAPPGYRLSTDSGQLVLALSPDGRTLVFVASDEQSAGVTQLYRRGLNDLVPEPIEGTEGAENPFFSPDGEWVGFASGQELKKIRLDGSGASVICDVSGDFSGGSWHRDGMIMFARKGQGLSRVSASGGAPESVTTLGPDDLGHVFPEVLPNGDAVLFTIDRGSVDVVGVHSFGDARSWELFEGSSPHYSPSGYLLYYQLRRDSLIAVPFDPATLTTSGEPTPFQQGPRRTTSGADFRIGRNGTLAYVASDGDFQSRPSQLVWVNRAGERSSLGFDPQTNLSLALSPDNTRAAVAGPSTVGLWVHDLERGTSIRFPGWGRSPVWSPDGARITYASWDGNGYDLVVRSADASGEATVLIDDGALYNDPASWTPDGSQILFARAESGADYDLYSIDVAGDHAVHPVLQTPFNDAEPVLSPDGDFMAYLSNESGRYEVYVRPFPDTSSARWAISADGGTEPRWSSDGDTLFYRIDNQILAVPIESQNGFEPGKAEVVFEGRLPRVARSGSGRRRYDVGRNGERFLVSELEDGSENVRQSELIVVENWLEELKRLVPIE